MYIREVQVKNFGKLKNRQFHFSPGLNVIYGENGTGKSTLQQSLMSMLFGMEKPRGHGSRGNPYDRYEPWVAPSYYAGSMRFRTGGKNFYLERNFYHKEKSAYLVNEQEKEELSVEQGDLQMLLGGVSKAAYENTFFIRQGTILPQAELGSCLMDELHNLAETGDGSFELSRTFEDLLQKRKLLEKKQRKSEMDKKQQLELLCAQEQTLREQAEKISIRYRAKKEQVAQMQQAQREQSIHTQCEQRTRDAQSGQTLNPDQDVIHDVGYRNGEKKRKNAGLLVGLILSVLWLLFCLLLPVSRIVWAVGQAVLTVFPAAGIFVSQRRKCEVNIKKDVKEKLQNCDGQEWNENLREEISKGRTVLQVFAEELREAEIQLENNHSAQREVMETGGKNADWNQEIRAVALAEETLQSLAAKKGEVSAHQLNEAVSIIFDQITEGKYDRIELSSKYEPQISEGFRMKKPEAFSAGTMQQAYFAFRMAAGQFLEQEETLPYLLDEVFSMYDSRRLREVLLWLGAQERQIFLFTCQKREAECLRTSGIPFREIILTDEN